MLDPKVMIPSQIPYTYWAVVYLSGPFDKVHYKAVKPTSPYGETDNLSMNY